MRTPIRRLLESLVALAAVGTAWAQDAKQSPPPAERRHKADPRALELVRRADATTYRPVDAGLRSLRCDAEYVMTNGIRYRIAYAMEAPGKSTIAIRTTADGTKGTWQDQEAKEQKEQLDGLFSGERLETELEPFELAWREDDGVPVVVATKADGETADAGHIELRFLADGPVSDEVRGDSPDDEAPVRVHRIWERTASVFTRKRVTFEDPQHGRGYESWEYRTVDGIALPSKHVAWLGGLGGTLKITVADVNRPVTGPATLPEPAAAPAQAELDALDVAALVAKVREPFVGKSPDSVATLRLVRALAKKGDDAKAAIPALVWLLQFDRGDEPKDGAPEDFDEFHHPLVELLAKLRPESIRPLVTALKSPVTDQRMWAATALGKMGPDAAEATDALVAAIGDRMWMVGISASSALLKIGCPAEQALPAILAKADVWWMGEAYADEAIAFAAADPDGDRKLAGALLAVAFTIEREEDGRARGFEVIFKKRGAKLVPFLADAAKTADGARREQIGRALGCTGRPAFVVLAAWMDGDDAGLRLASLRGVTWAGADAVALAPKIAAQLASTETDAAEAAEAALVAIGAGAAGDVEAFLATRPASGADDARDRARRIVDKLRPK